MKKTLEWMVENLKLDGKSFDELRQDSTVRLAAVALGKEAEEIAWRLKSMLTEAAMASSDKS